MGQAVYITIAVRYSLYMVSFTFLSGLGPGNATQCNLMQLNATWGWGPGMHSVRVWAGEALFRSGVHSVRLLGMRAAKVSVVSGRAGQVGLFGHMTADSGQTLKKTPATTDHPGQTRKSPP